jgi:hypothetical protein
MYYNNGDKYEGEWINNDKYGFGIMYYNNGDIKIGMWKDDIFTDEKIKFPQCEICVKNIQPRDLVLSCGNCFNRICIDCKNKHYQLPTAGSLVQTNKLTCPFCTNIPLSFVFEIDDKVKNLIKNKKKCYKCKYCLDYIEYTEKNICSVSNENITKNLICDKCAIKSNNKVKKWRL